ncbi:hypothetical protein CEXT_45671 [Caerostris extrusa]|uniref:Uncharacterized protein n=1 Tax=Caerostris extrusa TaxID=172846 RepID=A0AAV4MGF8_CAEEX|nr:hypothetical protein CEXT_45671 [Caerostris extrusa]
MHFEQWYLQQSARDVNFPAYALFSDEVTFNRDVVCNVNLWAEEIPRPWAVPRGTASLDTKCVSRFGRRLLNRTIPFTMPYDPSEESDLSGEGIPSLLDNVTATCDTNMLNL